MRPALKSGLLPVWRDRDTLQIGIDPRRAVALAGVGRAAWVISLLDGSRDRAQVIEAATGRGVPAQAVERILAILAAAGALDDFPASTLRALPQSVRAGLAAELATVSLASRDGDGGARILARRRAARVCIYGADQNHAGQDGADRIGSAIADILTTSGVGTVASTGRPAQPGASAAPPTADPCAAAPQATGPSTAAPQTTGPCTAASHVVGPCTAAPQATGPGATAPQATGPGTAAPATGGLCAAVPQAGGGQVAGMPARAGLPGVAQAVRPDLAILTGYQPPEMALGLVRDQVPHLAASAGEAIGTVGPLVLPGRTTCLRCLDYTRADHDPAWPLILAQLGRRQPQPTACDAALVAAVAAQAAAQALAFIDRAPGAGPTANGTLELVLPAWQWRRRTWLPHPACTCRAAAASGREP